MTNDTKLNRAVNNAASKLEGAAVSASANKSLLPILEIGSSGAIEEAVHSFLRATQRTPCDDVLRALKSETHLASRRISSSFQLIASAEEAPTKGGIVPVIGMVSDQWAEYEKLESSGGIKITDEKTAESKYRPRNRREYFAKFIGNAGSFVVDMHERSNLAHKILMTTNAPSGLYTQLSTGMGSGAAFPDISGALPALLVAEALVKTTSKLVGKTHNLIRKFWSDESTRRI